MASQRERPTVDAVSVVGDTTAVLPADRSSVPYPLERREWTLWCASGNPIEGPWLGIDGETVLEVADAPESTTHLVVEGVDGYRMCIPVLNALSGLLAFDRDTQKDCDDMPRFLAPGIEGAYTVKNVVSIEAITLGPDDDPERYEDLLYED